MYFIVMATWFRAHGTWLHGYVVPGFKRPAYMVSKVLEYEVHSFSLTDLLKRVQHNYSNFHQKGILFLGTECAPWM